MSFWRKRGPDGRPSSLLEWDTSCPKFAERRPESSNKEIYKKLQKQIYN